MAGIGEACRKGNGESWIGRSYILAENDTNWEHYSESFNVVGVAVSVGASAQV